MWMFRLAFVLVLLLAPLRAPAKATGEDSRQEFPPLGCGSSITGEEAGCHFQDANPEIMVTLEELPPLGSGLYQASMPPQAPPLKGAGINISIDPPNATGCELDTFPNPNSGPLTFINDSLDPNDPVLAHAYDGEPPPSTLVGVWAYQFLLVNCQNPGSVLLRAAMNAFDGSGDEEGEAWNSTTLEVTIPEPDTALLGAAALGALATFVRRRR
jgi:hypothetical protein